MSQTRRCWLDRALAGPYIGGITRLAGLKGIDLANALGGMLSWQQRRRLDELAPTHLAVPPVRASGWIIPERSLFWRFAFRRCSGVPTPADCRRPSAPIGETAFPGRPAGPGDPGPRRFLGQQLSPGEKGNARTLSETPLAGRSLMAAPTRRAKRKPEQVDSLIRHSQVQGWTVHGSRLKNRAGSEFQVRVQEIQNRCHEPLNREPRTLILTKHQTPNTKH